MATGEALREVAQLIDALERRGVDVEAVTVGDDGRSLDLSVALPDGEATVAELVRAVGGPGTDSGTDPPGDRAADAPPDDPDDGSTRAEDGRGAGGEPTGADRGSNSGSDADAGDGGEPAGGGSESSADPAEPAGNGGEQAADSAGAVDCYVDGCDRTFDSDHGMKIHAAKAHETSGADSAQPHRDPDRLRDVYDRHDTFAEMRDALGADVPAQTVRRNMMKYGIHEPDDQPADGYAAAAAAAGPESIDDDAADDTDTTARGDDGPSADSSPSADDSSGSAGPPADEPAAEEVAADDGATTDEGQADSETVADGGAGGVDSMADLAEVEPSALPADVDLAALAEAVCESRTMYGFRTELALDRSTARDLLETFDLQELVTGRVGTGPVEETPTEEVVARIAESVDPSTDGGPGASAD